MNGLATRIRKREKKKAKQINQRTFPTLHLIAIPLSNIKIRVHTTVIITTIEVAQASAPKATNPNPPHPVKEKSHWSETPSISQFDSIHSRT